MYFQIKKDDVVTFETTFQILFNFGRMFSLSANVALSLLGLCAPQSYPVFTLNKQGTPKPSANNLLQFLQRCFIFVQFFLVSGKLPPPREVVALKLTQGRLLRLGWLASTASHLATLFPIVAEQASQISTLFDT